ncbi:response regulator [Desulfobacterota bacterium AH_259_B03_O07]|nr:response regulator [Desulfobacterota bacterium AH_259_B03_O07]
MANARIMVVEDESIVAKSIRNMLKELGYKVSAVASSGEEAIKKAVKLSPNLVLMDIVLKGKLDGVETAKHIRANKNIPVVYLTAYADNKTIERAKMTEPYGYIIKPFVIQDLQSAVEVALYKHEMESKLIERKKRVVNTLKSIGYAVVATDKLGYITYMNLLFEELIECKQEDALGKDIDIIKIIIEETHTPIENPVKKVIRQARVMVLSNCTLLIDGDRKELKVDIKASPIRDEEGDIIGAVMVLREVAEHKPGQEGFSGAQKLQTSVRKEAGMISLAVFSSSTLLQEGIRKILESEKDIEIVAEASNNTEIIPLIKREKPDVLFIDTALANLHIDEILVLLKNKHPHTKVLLLLHTVDEQLVLKYISLGALGFLLDKSNKEKLINAIKYVSRGEIWGEMKVIRKILNRLLTPVKGKKTSPNTNLTSREEEIVRLVVQGFNNKRISNKLFISQSTVKSHLANIFNKLGIDNRLQLALKFRN